MHACTQDLSADRLAAFKQRREELEMSIQESSDLVVDTVEACIALMDQLKTLQQEVRSFLPVQHILCRQTNILRRYRRMQTGGMYLLMLETTYVI